MLLLVMIMSIGAISAADANETLQGEVSDTNIALTDEVGDTNIATTSSDLKQEVNDTSPAIESVNDVDEINVDDSRNENHKVGDASPASDDVLSASDDDLLKHNENNFFYGGTWYYDFEDALSAAESNKGGTIKIWRGTYKYTSDDDDFQYKINTEGTYTIQPYGSDHQVIFDGENKGWFLHITNANIHVTISDITFKNGKGNDGPLEVEDGAQLTLYRCIFEGNHASSDGVSYGLGGAIIVDEGSLVANDCKFINNKADRHGGAICIEDSGSVTLNNCYFKDNKKGSDEANDFEDYSIDGGESADWSFTNCLFVGSGSLDIDVDASEKSVSITPWVDDNINLVVLYKDGKFYDDNPGASGRTTTFTDLEKGTYTVYMMKDDEKRYEYSGSTFTIIEPNFILDDDKVFETLSAAIDAIPNGGSGEIAVKGGNYTGSGNRYVKINNKVVTIRPKSDLDHVTFSGDRVLDYTTPAPSYFLTVGSNSKLTIEDITITGYFEDSALEFTAGSEGYISGCEFNNIKYINNQPVNPINAQNSNLALYKCTFESNGPTLFKSTIVNIDECTFTSNSGTQGGAINADSSTNLNVTNSEFNMNEANEGGAIYATNLELHGNEFIGNSANLGGAVYITSQSESLINMTYCVFDTNYGNYRNVYFESLTRKFNFEFNEYDLNLTIRLDDISYGSDSILYGNFDWGSNLNNTYTLLTGVADEENIFGDMVTVVNKKFEMNLGVLPGGTHQIVMEGMYNQGDSRDHFWQQDYYSDLYQNEFYLINPAYAKIGIDKAKISLTLEVKDVLIPETPVLNVYADRDLNYTIFIQNKYYQVQVVNGKGSMQLTGLDLGNYTVVAMRDSDDNYELAMNFTTFAIAKTYSNFLVLSTNVEYDTLNEAVANSNDDDTIHVKKGTYKNTGIVISNKTLEIIALEGAVFDAQGADANFIIVNEYAVADISGITFRGLHNRNTNYGAIVNHGYLSLTSCNFTDNKITKTTFAENGGAAIFSDGDLLDIDGCNFINNVAPLKVGTAAVTSLGHEDVSITDSKFINNTAREGGALHFKNIIQFEAAVTSCDFERNTAVKGSAIYVGNNSRYISVTYSDFKKNDIKNNLGEKTQLEGGVIYVNADTNDVTLDISLSNFEDNSNSNVDGGVICLDGSSKATIESCVFTNNSGKVGSVILIKNPYDKKLTLIMDSSAFTNNNATTGAVATSPKVTALIDECVFANNTGENRHIYSNGFTVVHDSMFDVKDAKLNAPSVQYGESSTITGTADIGTNIYAAANLTVAGKNNIAEIKNNAFTYDAGILSYGKYYAVLNNIVDNNNNIYQMDSITEIFRVTRGSMELNVSVDNITYGETLKVVESIPSIATGTVDYQLNGKYYTKDEIESLKLDAGKYTLVAIYDHDDFAFTSTAVNFEVYKANPTISVPDVDVKYNDSIVINIESDVASIYTIEIEDYRNVVFVNGSRSIVIDKTLNPGNYTIKVTSQERVNYISNSTEAILNVNGNIPVFSLSISNANMADIGTGNVGETDSAVDVSNNVQSKPLMAIRYFAIDDTKSKEQLSNSPDNNLGEEYEEGRFLFQYDEDDDYDYFDTLEDAVDEAVLYGSGIITVRGGTYPVYSIDIEGEVELTIKAYENEEVIFDCGGEYYFMLLTYDTEMEWVQVPPPPHPEFEQTDGPTVTLENITVINGVANYGGAIDLRAGTLVLNNCNFHNNHANDEGGAIYIGTWDAEYDATLIAVNTTFTNNYAESEGGAIYIASDNLDGQTTSASFMLCTFLDNYQGEDEERMRNYFAGGNADEIICQYCIFNANGEIYNFTMDKINQAVYVNGTSNDTFDSVVLLYFDTAPLYTINNNGSSDFSITFEDVMGGNYTVGVMNDHDFNTYIFDVKFEMKVPNFIISEDEVYENLTDAIDAVAENGVIYANANYYLEEQMGIDISKSFTLKNFRGRDVVFDGNSTTWFFTIAEGCTVAFEGIYFTDGAVKNHASIENYGTLVINNCTFDSFETAEIIYNSGLLNLLNSTFSLNFVNNAVVFNDGQLFIDTVEFSSNIVNMSSVVYTNGAAEIISANFTDNFNLGNGGAIYNAKSLSVKDTVFTENEGYNGGAVYSEGTLEVINSTFEDNTANGYGGAIYNGNEANIFNSTFTGSSSEFDGGAIYNNNVMVIDNSTFVGNTATGRGGAIYNNKSLVLTKSLFGINYAEEFANIYNAGDIQFSENIFDFYDVILVVPDGEYGIPTTITGTLNPEFNMDLQTVLPGFVNQKDATVTIQEGVFEYVTDILPKGIYDVVLNEVIYDIYGNIYYGEAITDRLVINKANVYINLTVDDIVLRNTDQAAPVLKISASKDGLLSIVFNNKILNVNIVGGQATVTLDAVGEGNYTVFAAREGDENYNDAVNTTTFAVTEYEGNFIVNSTGGKFDTLREAIENSANEDIIYVMEGNYTGADNLGLSIYSKKLTIISLGDVVFNGDATDLNFLTVDATADVTICDVVVSSFNVKNKVSILENRGDLTLDGCIFINNTYADDCMTIVYNSGNLNITGSAFYDNIAEHYIIQCDSGLVINESTFENNTVNEAIISIHDAQDSSKIISTEFIGNTLSCALIDVVGCSDVLISSEFYNNTKKGEDIVDIVYARDSNLLVENSIFRGNAVNALIRGMSNNNVISESLFTDNTVANVVFSADNNLSVIDSIFTGNTLSDDGALCIAVDVHATVNGCVFSDNKADEYRNIYSVSTDVNIVNTTFDAINVDFTVHDIDYGQNETIEGTIDIGTNINFTVNLDINSKIYSVNVSDNKFTLNAGILNGGDYTVVLNPKDTNSNTFVFDKITKVFTVSRIDPGLSVSIDDITQGEKLNVTSTIAKNAKGNVVYELNGNVYSKAQLENLTLTPGSYLVTAVYRGDKNYLPASEMVNVKVNKVAPNITVNDVAVDYGDEIKINVTVGAADYYTVFLDNRYNESVSLYVDNSAIFTFPSETFKAGSYKITVYVFESDNYAEEYAYATLTLNKAIGVFNLTNDTIIQGENATITVEVPLNAYGNIAYNVYDVDGKSVYSIVQSCLENLTVPNLNPGKYIVNGTYEGDSYYSNESIISSSEIFVRECVDIIITVGNITYGENATVTVESNVDGEYLVYVGTEPIVVTVIKGTGNVSVSNLNAGSYVANVTVIDGNYSGFNETVFGVAPKSTSVDISIEDIVFGENAIAVVNGEIDGEYIIEIDNQNYTVNVVDGKGNTAIDGLAIGEDILASITIANANYAASNTTTFNVFSRYNTPIEMDMEIVENNITMTVTINDKATGLVKFQVTGQEEYVVYSDVIDGVAILEDVLETGDYTVVATYMGNDRFNTNITYADFTIKGHIKKNTTIDAHADVVGYRVTLTVTVDENATGFVKLVVGGTVANIELENGKGTLTTNLLPNSYYIDVTYLGDDDYNMNSTAVTFTVTEISKDNTTIDLNVIAGEDTAWIVVDLNETATGLVKFYMVNKETGENATMYMDVVEGHVETFTNSLTPGNYTVVATYMGDSVFNTNTTSKGVEILGHILKDTPIEATVETNANRVILTVKVDENATGFVKVTVGGTVANIELENGKGILTTVLPYGSYSLNITYLGDANYNKNSTKSEFTLVEPAKENTPIALDVVTDENYVGMTATVSDAATGLVKFQVIGSTGEYTLYADVIGGKAILEDTLPVGNYTVLATFMGDSRFNTNITYKDFTIVGHIKKDTPINARADVNGNRVTLTVNVDEDATGFVKLTIGGTVTNIEVVDGVATLTTLLVPNSYYVDVTYLGDDDFNMNSTKVSFTITEVAKKNTNIDLNIIAYEDTALIMVDLNKATTGLVKFYMVWKETGEEYTMYMDVVDGHVETLTNNIEPGNYTVVATYMGDSVFNTNTTSEDVEIIGHVLKDTPITASVVSSGTRVTLTAKVDEEATGFVELKFGDNVFNIALKDGIGTLTTSLPYGSYSLDITYLGDENYNKNSTKLDFTLVEPAKENTPIALDIVTDESYVGMTVILDDAATGLVKFHVTGEEDYVVYSDVIDGVAILEDVLTVGNYSVIATYMGDSRFNTNITYGDFTIKGHIKKDTPISARAVVNGNRVTLTANVDEDATGFVKLTISGTVVNVEVVDGVATLTTTLPANSYFVDVTYLGDEDFNMNSTKVVFTITEVSKLNTTIDLNIVTYEDAAFITVDLDKAATGLVKFYMVWKETGENSTVYMDVVDGHVESYTNSIAPGNYSITVTYMGDSVFNTNTTSGDVEILGHILKDTPITANVAANGNRVTLTAKVDEEATGFVELKFGDNVFNIALKDGIGTLTTSLPYGSYSLDITYLGDENYNKNSTKLEFTLTEPAKENTPISMDIVTYEDEVWMTVSVDDAATGLVKFQVTGPEEFTLYVDVIDGKAIVDEVLLIGDYSVIVTYMGDSRFNTNITYGDFTIAGHIKKDTPIDAHAVVNGNRVTLTVNVDEDATGFVKLAIGGTVTNIEVVDGVAKLTTTLLPNSYYVDVTYLGDNDFNMNNTKVTFTVTEASKKDTPIDLNVTAGEDVIWITVDLDKDATGLVKLYMVWKETGENITAYMDVIDGRVETLTNSLLPGNYSVVATYMGDSLFNTNTTSKDVEIIGHVMKDTPISANVAANGNRVTLTVTVDEEATGFVELKFGDNVFNIALKDGIGTLTTSLPYGSYSLDITYLGDENYNKNSTKLEFTLTEPAKENTPISLDIVTYENDVLMTVTVDDAATGLVKFQVTGPEEFTLYVDVIDGIAVVEEVLLTGDYSVVATFMGDSKFNTNITYGDFTISGHIKKDTPISAHADVIGNRVTLTVNVDEDATGFVKLTISGTVVNVEVVDGVAKLTTTLPANSYFADVTYLGDEDFNMNSTQVTFTITEVSKQNTTIDLNISVYEDTALVMVDLNNATTGLVKLYMLWKETGEEYTMYMDVVDGHVETLTNSILPGNYTIVATYMGDSVFNTNTTSQDVEIIGHVMKDTPITVDAVVNGSRVTLTAEVDANATGLVKFEIIGDEGNSVYVDVIDGKAVIEGVLKDGNYTVIAIYMGDFIFNANVTSLDFTINAPKSANITVDVPSDIKAGEDIPVTVDIPGGSGNVSVIVDGVETVVPIVDGKANYTIPALDVGNHTVVVSYPGDDAHVATTVAKSISVSAIASEFTNITVSGSGVISVSLVDETGSPIANANLTYTINGKPFTGMTDSKGGVVITVSENSVVELKYAGTSTILPANATITLKDLIPIRTNTSVLGNNYTQYAIEYYSGERGQNFTVKLVDSMGNPLANQTVLIGYNGKCLFRITNATGHASVQINLVAAQRLTFAVAFLGDDDYNGTMSVYLITINKKPVTMTAADKTYKATAKTKKYTVTLKTIKGASADGKTYFTAGKKVTMKLNGKTYTAKTNSKGQATFNLDITKKGKFNAVIEYAGDNTYVAVSKSVKITIK